MENLQQQLRSIEAEHQARMAAWNQHSANNVHQQNMGGDSGGRKSRWDKTAPVGKFTIQIQREDTKKSPNWSKLCHCKDAQHHLYLRKYVNEVLIS